MQSKAEALPGDGPGDTEQQAAAGRHEAGTAQSAGGTAPIAADSYADPSAAVQSWLASLSLPKLGGAYWGRVECEYPA